MDNGTKRSIEDMIKRAKIETQRLNYKIDDITEEILPYINSLIGEFLDMEERSARDLDIKFDCSDDTENLIEIIDNGLNDVRNRLAKVDFSKEEIINDSSIGMTNEILDKVKSTLKIIIRKAIVEKQQNMNKNTLEKNRLVEEKKKIEIEMALLIGKKEGLEETAKMSKSKSKREVISEKISLLKDQIQNLKTKIQQKDFEISLFEFREEEETPKENNISKEEKNTQKIEEDNQK